MLNTKCGENRSNSLGECEAEEEQDLKKKTRASTCIDVFHTNSCFIDKVWAILHLFCCIFFSSIARLAIFHSVHSLTIPSIANWLIAFYETWRATKTKLQSKKLIFAIRIHFIAYHMITQKKTIAFSWIFCCQFIRCCYVDVFSCESL